MQLVTFLHHLADLTPPHAVAISVLIALAIATLLFAASSSRATFFRIVPPVFLVIAGEAALWPLTRPRTPRLHFAALVVAALALLAETLRRLPESPPPSGTASSANNRLALVVALAGAALLLLHDLGSYSGILLTWESPVTAGFGEAFRTGTSSLRYLARHLLWDDGLVSAGHTSLFYGVPTYALLPFAGFSPWTLRIFAVVAGLMSIAVIHALGRRFFSPTVGAVATILLALDPAMIFYGRYGTSLAGTVLAVLLALFTTWLFLERSRWWLAVPCTAALYAATLQYSPARIVVLLLLGWIVLACFVQPRRFDGQRLGGVAIILASAMLVWHAQGKLGTQQFFLNARGEQYLHFVRSADSIEGLFGKPLLGHPAHGRLGFAEQRELAAKILAITVPQGVSRLSPALDTPPRGAVLGLDPPPLPLYFAPLAPFILWGIAASLRRLRSGPFAFLLVWAVFGTVPLLFTNRVDAHRLVLFVIPLSLWAAIGVAEGMQRMSEAGLPRGIGIAGASLLFFAMIGANVDLLFYDRAPQPIVGAALGTEIATIPGPVIVAALGDHRDLAWLQLGLLERARRDPNRPGSILRPERVEEIRGLHPASVPARDLARSVAEGTLLLAPAEEFHGAAAGLQSRGLRVSRRERAGLAFLRIDAGAEATGISNEELHPLPTLIVPPTPTPVALDNGPQVSLTDLEPIRVEYGFSPPQINRSWDKGPLILDGVRYERGIGAHAWSRSTYALPERAFAFQAIIGINDTARKCPQAAVTFELGDDRGSVLYDSGLVDGTTASQPIHVELHGARTVTLVVTEGGNGRDCDHADWAEPAFLLR